MAELLECIRYWLLPKPQSTPPIRDALRSDPRKEMKKASLKGDGSTIQPRETIVIELKLSGAANAPTRSEQAADGRAAMEDSEGCQSHLRRSGTPSPLKSQPHGAG
ncbi:hypothetical protein AOLI_G00070660 [Acnodon oligacanthus]